MLCSFLAMSIMLVIWGLDLGSSVMLSVILKANILSPQCSLLFPNSQACQHQRDSFCGCSVLKMGFSLESFLYKQRPSQICRPWFPSLTTEHWSPVGPVLQVTLTIESVRKHFQQPLMESGKTRKKYMHLSLTSGLDTRRVSHLQWANILGEFWELFSLVCI